MKKKIINTKIMEKSVMFSICIMLMLSLLTMSVMGQCGPGGCPVPSGGSAQGVLGAGASGAGGEFEFTEGGSGILWDTKEQKLTTTSNENTKPATLNQLITDLNFYMKNQDNADQSQRNEFTEDRLKNKLGLDISGKENLFHGKWLDENTFQYGEIKLNKDELQGLRSQTSGGFEKANFKSDGSITLTDSTTGYELRLKGALTPQTPQGADASFNPSASSGAFDGGGGGGGGGSGGGGSGGAGGGFEQAFQVAQQMVQLAQQLIGPLAESLKSNGKGKTSISSPNEYGGVTAEMERGAGIALNRNGEDTLLALNEEGKSVVKTKKDEKEVEVENADILVPKQLAAEIEQETTVALNGIPDNDPSNPQLRDSPTTEIPQVGYVAIFFPLFNLNYLQLLPLVSAQQVNFGQYIKLFEHNLDISGSDLTIYALKTFNKVEAGGQNLVIHSGNIEIKIEGQRIMYPRLVKDAPYGFAQLSNKLDQNNKFRLQHYTDKKGIFYDDNQITSVGDITIKHPEKNLIISKIREDMWYN